MAHLASVGFPGAINRPEDFYAAVRDGTVPQHDAVVTNPPFSADHIDRFLTWATERADGPVPWCALVPQHTTRKPAFFALEARLRQGCLRSPGTSTPRPGRGGVSAASSATRNHQRGSAVSPTTPAAAAGTAFLTRLTTACESTEVWSVATVPTVRPSPKRRRVDAESEGVPPPHLPPLLYVGPTRAPYEFAAPVEARQPITSATSASTGRSHPIRPKGPPTHTQPLRKSAVGEAGSGLSRAASNSGPAAGEIERTSAEERPLTPALVSTTAETHTGATAAGEVPVRAGFFQCVWIVGGLGDRAAEVAARLGVTNHPPTPSPTKPTPTVGAGERRRLKSPAPGDNQAQDGVTRAGKRGGGKGGPSDAEAVKLGPSAAVLAGVDAAVAADPMHLPQLTIARKLTPAERRWRKKQRSGRSS